MHDLNNSTSSDDDDEKRIMGMSWKKLEEQLLTNAFREGAGAGKDTEFQNSFDRGYADGFQKSRSLGVSIGEQRILQFTRRMKTTNLAQDGMKNPCGDWQEQKDNAL